MKPIVKKYQVWLTADQVTDICGMCNGNMNERCKQIASFDGNGKLTGIRSTHNIAMGLLRHLAKETRLFKVVENPDPRPAKPKRKAKVK